MKRHHRPSHSGSIIRSIAMACVVMLAIASGNIVLAQNPAYQFASSIGGTGTERNWASAVDVNGNVYATGRFEGTVDFDPGAGTANLTAASTYGDVYVASFSAAGNYRWAFRIGAQGGSSYSQEGRSIAVDASGNVVVSGGFYGTADFDPGPGTANLTGTAASGYGGFVARYSTTGTYLWAFQLWSFSGPALSIDVSGNVVVTGRFSGTVDFDPGSGKANLTSAKVAQGNYSQDICVAKYSSSGNYLWAFKVGGPSDDYARAVAVDGSGNIDVTGYFSGTVDFNPSSGTANLTASGTSGSFDVYVARYSGSGAYLSAFRIGGTNSEVPDAIAVDGNGTIVLTGTFSGTVDFDPGTGTANLTSIGGANNIFIARYSSAGGYLWAFSPSGSGNAWSIAIDGSSNVYITGAFNSFIGTNDFDPGAGTVSFAGVDGFVAKYTASGSYLWAFAIMDSLTGRSIAVDASGDIRVTGDFVGTADLDPSDSTANLASVGGSDIVVARYAEAVMPKRTVHGNSTAIAMTVAPNPFTSTFAVTYPDASPSARVEVMDMMGRVVTSLDAISSHEEIRLGESLPAGAYLVRVIEGDRIKQVLVRKVR